MSGILRNALRLVDTTKYVKNNPTKYLRSMMHTTSRINSSVLLKPNYFYHHESGRLNHTLANRISTNFWTTIRATGNKILSAFGFDEVNVSIMDNYRVILRSGHVEMKPSKYSVPKKFPFLPTYSIEYNKELYKPNAEITADEKKKPLLFSSGKWNGSLDGEQLILKLKDSDETFILKHALHVEAHTNLTKHTEINTATSSLPEFHYDVTTHSASIISKPEGSAPSERFFPLKAIKIPAIRFKSFRELFGIPKFSAGYSRLSKSDGTILNNNITDAELNGDAEMKLEFPMTASLKGALTKITIRNCDDYFTVHHTVDIQAYKDKYSKNETTDEKNEKTLKGGKLLMQFEPGNLIIEALGFSDLKRITIENKVYVRILLESEIPSIGFCAISQIK